MKRRMSKLYKLSEDLLQGDSYFNIYSLCPLSEQLSTSELLLPFIGGVRETKPEIIIQTFHFVWIVFFIGKE